MLTPRERAEKALENHFGFPSGDGDFLPTEEGRPGLGTVIEEAVIEVVTDMAEAFEKIMNRV